MTTFRKTIVVISIIYSCAFSLSILHNPSYWGLIWYRLPRALLGIPLSAPWIVKAYIKLLPHDPWPWTSPDDAIGLSELIHRYGKKEECSLGEIRSICSSVSFNVGNSITPFGTDYDVNEYGYSTFIRNAAIPISPSSPLVRIGRYVCFVRRYGGLLGTTTCAQFFQSDRAVYLHNLDKNKVRKIRFINE